jgi:hypothetical protein
MRRALSLLAVAVLGGCSSLSTTYVGEAKSGATFQGMPVVVQRPKYLKVTHKQVTYLPLAKKTTSGGGSAVVEVTPLGSAQTVDQIETEVVSVGEVYALDLKRPAAGNTEYGIEFDTNSQYPKKVGAKIEDKTIEAATNALGSLLEKGAAVFKPAAAPDSGVPVELMKISEKVVKIELRSLDDPKVVYVVFDLAK